MTFWLPGLSVFANVSVVRQSISVYVCGVLGTLTPVNNTITNMMKKGSTHSNKVTLSITDVTKHPSYKSLTVVRHLRSSFRYQGMARRNVEPWQHIV